MFGKKLKKLRKEFKMSQEDLGTFLNMDRSTIGKWENNNSRPDFENLINISKFFEVSTDYLLGITEIRNPYSSDSNNISNYNFFNLGYKLKQLRLERNMSLENLGKELNLPSSLIKLYESDLRRPDYNNLMEIAQFFHVSIDYLLGLSTLKNINLDEDIQKFIDNFLNMDIKNKNKVLDYIRLIKLDEKNKD